MISFSTLTLKSCALIFTVILLTFLLFLKQPPISTSDENYEKLEIVKNPIIFRENNYYAVGALNNDDYIEESDFNELDGCYHVYLDVGSNVGNQIRKLFEPHLYLNATILPLFDQYFGDTQIRNQKPGVVCAVGFEPNPRHTKILQNIQSVYNKCEWKTKIFTTTAAAHCYGMARFFTDNNTAMNEWGGSILKSKIANNSAGVAKMIRLADYILKKVITRKLPAFLNLEEMEIKPNVLMKMDIEGSELEVLSDLVVTGALQYIDLAMVEYHSQSFYKTDFRSSAISGLEKAMDTFNYLSNTLRLKSVYNVKTFNDDSYTNVNFPLPEC